MNETLNLDLAFTHLSTFSGNSLTEVGLCDSSAVVALQVVRVLGGGAPAPPRNARKRPQTKATISYSLGWLAMSYFTCGEDGKGVLLPCELDSYKLDFTRVKFGCVCW